MTNSTSRTIVRKPREDFPLFPHATGRWAKKVRGKFHYFGKVTEDPKGKAALVLWLDQYGCGKDSSARWCPSSSLHWRCLLIPPNRQVMLVLPLFRHRRP